MNMRIVDAMSVPEGDGVTVKRLMPIIGLRHLDPIVLWDHFDIAGGGFPDHPHRGFEGITYLFDGGMNHTDNLGNQGTIHAGGGQRFTAGRGIVHSEFPEGRAHGIQLWINLPKRLKSIPADYQQATSDEIPEHQADNTTIRNIIGKEGAIKLHTPGEYLELFIPDKTIFKRSVQKEHCGLIYLVSGSVVINGKHVSQSQAALFDSAEAIRIEAQEDSRLMWCFFQPHGEAIYQHGPFVD